MKVLSVFAATIMLGVLGVLAPKPSVAQVAAPNGAGWYFVSICGYYGEAATLCWFGQAGWFGPFTSDAQCTSTLTTLVNSNSILVTTPYAPSNCFYLN